jgi:hypothetical protein
MVGTAFFLVAALFSNSVMSYLVTPNQTPRPVTRVIATRYVPVLSRDTDSQNETRVRRGDIAPFAVSQRANPPRSFMWSRLANMAIAPAGSVRIVYDGVAQ